MEKTSRRTTMKAIAAAGIAGTGAFAAPRAARAETTWELYTYYPVSTGSPARGVTKIAEDVEKATSGQLKIKVHLGGSLPIQAASITSAVASNVVQIASDIFSVGNVPIVAVTRLPMLIHDPKEYEIANAIMMPYLEAAYDKRGLVVLGRILYPQQSLWSRKKLTSVADINGKKIRLGSPEQGELIRRFGGTVLTLGSPEVPAALDRGLVDGIITAAAGGGYIWRDLLKYNYLFPVNFLESLIIANKEALEKLPESERSVVRQGAADCGTWVTQTLAGEEQDLREKMKAAGLIVTEVQPQDLQLGQQNMTSYWDEWAKTQPPEIVEALGKVRKALGR
jgi:TRAP-type C4-dicarboxylate transport system substrate-binding protein